MGVTLRHAIKIDASAERVFKALTDTSELASWHDGTVDGAVTKGSVLSLESKPGLKFGWETKELIPNERVVQKCVEGPGATVGKTLTFSLKDLGGETQVALSDGEWDDGDSSLPFCNTHWGAVLHRLTSHVEH